MGQKWAPGALQIALGSGPGAKNNSLKAPGGAQEGFWSPITPIRGRPGVDFGFRLGGPGPPRSELFQLSFEICDFSKNATLPHENLIFKVRGLQNRTEMTSKWLQNCFRQQVRPKTALKRLYNRSQIALGSLRAPKKIVGGRPGGAKRKFGDRFHPPSKPTPPPRGGEDRSAHLGFGAFFFEIAAAASAGCKNRGSRVSGGHSWGWGEKLKLLQTTSKLVVLKLRCAKLETPHVERGRGHTTARPVGRRISANCH